MSVCAYEERLSVIACVGVGVVVEECGSIKGCVSMEKASENVCVQGI